MKGVIFEQFGPPEVLKVKTDLPKPVRKPGQCLVQIAATSVNPIDWKTRKGELPRFMVKLPNVCSSLSFDYFLRSVMYIILNQISLINSHFSSLSAGSWWGLVRCCRRER